MKVKGVIIGSGLSGLKSYALLSKQLSSPPLIIDFTFGGSLVLPVDITKLSRVVPKIPIFISTELASFFPYCNIKCLPLEVIVLKEGDLIDKVKGYTTINVQRLWIYEILKKNEVCFFIEPNDCIFKSLNIAGNTSLNRVRDNIRKIDVERKNIVTSQGLIIEYDFIVYTWPIHSLRNILANISDISVNKMLATVDSALNYVSIYSQLYLINEKISEQKISVFVHGTKTYRMHTTVKVPISDNLYAIYVLTSYSKSYPLHAGIGEKLYSEAKKLGLINPAAIIDYADVNITYGFLGTENLNIVDELRQALGNYNIHLFGRIAEWREYDVATLLLKAVPTIPELRW